MQLDRSFYASFSNSKSLKIITLFLLISLQFYCLLSVMYSYTTSSLIKSKGGGKWRKNQSLKRYNIYRSQHISESTYITHHQTTWHYNDQDVHNNPICPLYNLRRHLVVVSWAADLYKTHLHHNLFAMISKTSFYPGAETKNLIKNLFILGIWIFSTYGFWLSTSIRYLLIIN